MTGLDSPIVLQKSEEHALERLGSNLGGCITALESLNGSLAIYSHIGGDSIWRFKHPTIGDAYATILAQNPELLGIFLQGIAPDKLIGQVTCGEVGVEKAVIIPRGLFPDVLVRLRELTMSKNYKSKFLSVWSAKSALKTFLAHRCSRDFLSLYIKQDPDLLDEVSEPGLYLGVVPEVRLAVRLNELGLLPEEIRKKFVATVSEYAVRCDDLYALDDLAIREVFEDYEFNELLQSVRTQLLPRLDDVRREVQDNYPPSEPSADYMQQLLESFDILMKHFGDDTLAAETIRKQTRLVNEWIAENATDEQGEEPRTLGIVGTTEQALGARSVFDDVDV